MTVFLNKARVTFVFHGPGSPYDDEERSQPCNGKGSWLTRDKPIGSR
uniref:Uncharacterized protein n=1 Tax=Tetranychus urticae TaxID=32264 RepID=T1JZX4_TETUR